MVLNHIRLKSYLRYLLGNVNKTTCFYINKFKITCWMKKLLASGNGHNNKINNNFNLGNITYLITPFTRNIFDVFRGLFEAFGRFDVFRGVLDVFRGLFEAFGRCSMFFEVFSRRFRGFSMCFRGVFKVRDVFEAFSRFFEVFQGVFKVFSRCFSSLFRVVFEAFSRCFRGVFQAFSREALQRNLSRNASTCGL